MEKEKKETKKNKGTKSNSSCRWVVAVVMAVSAVVAIAVVLEVAEGRNELRWIVPWLRFAFAKENSGRISNNRLESIEGRCWW